MQLMWTYTFHAKNRLTKFPLGRICSRAGDLAPVLIDEGGKFLGRPRGEGLLEKFQERGYASA